MSLQISYIPQPIAKLLICCMPSVCKTPPLRAILDRSDVWKRVLYSCHSFSIPCLLSSLSEFVYDPDMLLFLSKIQNTCTNPTPTPYACCFHFILFWSPIRIWAKVPGWITARDRCRWHAERNERSLVGSWRQGYIGNLGHVFMD